MLTITEAASARLAELLDQEGVSEDTAIRFVYEGQGIAVAKDTERPGDTTFQHGARTVLLLDAQVSELLTNDTLDLEGAELMLRHPQEDG